MRFGLEALAQDVRERLKVGCEMLTAGHAGVVSGKLVIRIIIENRWPAQGRDIHAERAEQTDVSPALPVLARPAALVDRNGQLERASVERGFEPDRPGAQYRQTWCIALGHGNALCEIL